MFAQMASTTLENIQKVHGKKFIDIILGIAVLSVLTSVCYYLGFLRSLGIYMSDLNISIFELLDIEIITTIAIIYSVAYGHETISHEKKHANHDELTTSCRFNTIMVLGILFLLMIFAIYKGPYDSDAVFGYLTTNISLFLFPSIITGFLMWCILTLHKKPAVEFALIFCAISLFSYTAGVFRAEELILKGTENQHSITLANGKKMDVFLIKSFNAGDLVFYKNEPTFIDKNSDRILRFKKLSAITAESTGVKTTD